MTHEQASAWHDGRRCGLIDGAAVSPEAAERMAIFAGERAINATDPPGLYYYEWRAVGLRQAHMARSDGRG